MVSDRRRVHKIVKIAKEKSPKYLSNYIKYFQNKNWKIQIQFCISQWSKLSNLTKQLANIKKFKNTLIIDLDLTLIVSMNTNLVKFENLYECYVWVWIINWINKNFIINLVLFGPDKYHKEINRNIPFDCII